MSGIKKTLSLPVSGQTKWVAVLNISINGSDPVKLMVCGECPTLSSDVIRVCVIKNPVYSGTVDQLSVSEYTELSLGKEAAFFKRQNGVAVYTEFSLV